MTACYGTEEYCPLCLTLHHMLQYHAPQPCLCFFCCDAMNEVTLRA